MSQVTNEVLAERIDGLKTLVLDKLESIEKQTIKTNGRTTASEIKLELLEGKFNKLLGGLIVIDFVLAGLLAVALTIYKT